jgi:hypothetical protein
VFALGHFGVDQPGVVEAQEWDDELRIKKGIGRAMVAPMEVRASRVS